MKRALLVTVALTGAPVASLVAQAVPDAAQANKVQEAYRRTPSFRNDPFRHISIPHWGLVFSGGGLAGNNSLNLSDIGAVRLLGDRDSLGVSEVLNMLGLVPAGSGVDATAQGEGAVYLGGPIGAHLGIGLSARGTGYGAFHLDDNIVALLRDGNGARQDFSLGTSKGTGLATAEAGAHMIVRLGPLSSPDGMRLNLGVGARYIRPVAYAREQSTISNGGIVRITGDSVVANIAIEQLLTRSPGTTARRGGTNIAADFLVRMEWPTQGFALEAMVANIGSVSVPLVERSTFNLNVASTSLQAVQDSLDRDVTTAGFDFRPFLVQDTATFKVHLPRIVRFSASSWANRILQIDVGATLPVTGDFQAPLAIDLGTTWRLLRTFPLRAGVVLGGTHGIGYSGGFAIEGRTVYFQVAGQSLGGLFKRATGVGARFELGFFF